MSTACGRPQGGGEFSLMWTHVYRGGVKNLIFLDVINGWPLLSLGFLDLSIACADDRCLTWNYLIGGLFDFSFKGSGRRLMISSLVSLKQSSRIYRISSRTRHRGFWQLKDNWTNPCDFQKFRHNTKCKPSWFAIALRLNRPNHDFENLIYSSTLKTAC